jgi:hypothetical protein
MGIVKLPRVSELSFHFQERRGRVELGLGMEGFVWDVLPRVTVGVEASDRPTCYPCPADPASSRLTLCFYTSTSRQASAPNLQAGVCPGEPTGARRLPKPFSKKFYLNEPQFLWSLTSGAHSPDVDDQSSSHCHDGLFLEHFVSALKTLAPLQDGAVVRLKTH